MKKELINKKKSFEVVDSALADFGFEHLTGKVSENECWVFSCRTEQKEAAITLSMEAPPRTAASITSMEVDNALPDVVVHFWEPFHGREQPAIDKKTKYLLSLANEAGARRFRQATYDLIKAYATGVTVAELDELSGMFTQNQGVGAFASEIGPWPLFDAYQLIKRLEKKGMSREKVIKELIERFGEKNVNVGGVLQRQKN